MNKFSTLFKSFFLISLIITTIGVNAGEIKVNNGSTKVEFNSFSYQQVSLSASLSSIQFRDVQTTAGTFTELFVQGFGYSNAEGDPKLPVYKKLIEIPLGASCNVVVNGQSFKEYDLQSEGIMNSLIPAQPPVSKSSKPEDIKFIWNTASYQKDKWFGEPLATITYEGIQRSVRLARLEISPVQYNPVTGKIRVYDNLQITVQFTGANVAGTISLKKQTYSPYFNNLYKLLPNYQSVPDSLITTGPVTYVIVSAPMFKDALQPFVQWKKKKGFRVIQGYTDDPAVGATSTSIQAWLTNLYNTPPSGYNKPSFVLFVGDVAQIPAFNNGGHPSDLYYCDYTSDNIPEVFYGRFSASSLVQLQPYIDKTLEYEKYEMPSDAFLGEVTMVAGADASHQLTWGNGQINYGTTYYFNTAHNLLSHTYLQPEPSGGNYSALIRGDVSNGVAYANYTAHGSETGWSDPQFIISQIPPLVNDHKYCLMVGNCCLTAKYSVNCFAEEITRAANKGALGYIGCSDYSYWDEDYWWGCGFKAVTTNPTYNPAHLGAYDVTFHDQGEPTSQWFVTQGQMVQGGNLAVQESGSSMKLYYWQAYNLMGDPSLMVYFSIPPDITATYPSTLITGASSLQVITEPYAYVALTQDTTLIDAKCADITGVVDFNFSPINNPDTISVVITKQNRKPHFGSINVIPASGPYVVINSFAVNDSVYGNHNHKADYSEKISLDVVVKNIGVAPSGDVVGMISTSDTNVTILGNSYDFGTVPAGGTVAAKNIFSIKVNDLVDDQYIVNISLELTDGTNTWTSPINLVLNAPVLTPGDMTVLDPAPGGNGNGVLDPGESAVIKITLTNNGHAVATNTKSSLLTDPASASWILINNPVQYVGTLGTTLPVNVSFNVVVNGITPEGTVVNLTNNVTAGQLNQFTASKAFTPEIGQLPQYIMTNSTINTCSGRFYDSGGPAGNYSDNEDYTMTFNTSTPGATLHAEFVMLDVEQQTSCNYDWLKAYNGPNTTSPLLGTWCGTSAPSPITGTNGSLTFEFNSDYSENFAGWEVVLSCTGGTLGLNANAFPANVCAGNSSQLTAMPTGGSGNYTYQWTPSTYLDDPTSKNPVCTPLAGITYTVTVNDGTSQVTSSPVVITVLPVPATPVVTVDAGTLVSSSATGNQWYLNGAMIPGATSQTYSPGESGEYYVVVTDQVNGCPSEPSNIIPFWMTGIGNSTSSNVIIYPNPANDRFMVSFDLSTTENYKIDIIDGTGRTVKSVKNIPGLSGKNMREISTLGIPDGIYYLNITTSSFQTVKKLIISK